MKHKILLPLGLLLVLLVACGSDSSDVASEGEPGDDNPTTSIAPGDGDPSVGPDDSIVDDVEPAPDDDLPIGGDGTLATLDIVVSHPSTTDVSYTISCLGDTATITGDVGLNDFAACEQLGDEAVRNRLINGPITGLACTEIYGGPDIATITGTYDGVDGPAVETTIDRTNGCGIGEWDNLLSAILPPALGVTE